MKFSVIIVNYNVKFFLEQALISVYKALQGIEAEVFVVDNNSVDGSVAMVRSRFPQATLIANTDNKGFSKANNQAIALAKGEYVLLLNPDTVVEEDTFSKVIHFMDTHPDAGGLGVNMIDGRGNFLPESKRGLPTPAVAFYKIFGLAALFPKSKLFGRYHLGYLSKDETHEVEILSGAFMLLRKSVLDKIGYLDEDFFMYGEDIDLSYRIIKAGYKNYYYHDAKIIHYKGESTKKSSVNYVFVFYNAMVIFARKHFSQKHAQLFSALIHIAIYLRAGIAILYRFLKRIFLPLLDFGVIYAGAFFTKSYWEDNIKYIEGGYYPGVYASLVIPLYIITLQMAGYFSGAYDKPYKLNNIIRGTFWGTVFILVIYALLPESYRFSRALILLDAVIAVIAMFTTRLVLHWLGIKDYKLDAAIHKRAVVVGTHDEALRVQSLIKQADSAINFIGFISPSHPEPGTISDYIGTIDQMQYLVEVYDIQEVIFCARDVSSQQIIGHMSQANGKDIEYKIAPPETLYIIGSNSIDNNGELYTIELNTISRAINVRNKRLFDILASFIILICSPLLLLTGKFGIVKNIFAVFTGKKSWVGYANIAKNNLSLPEIKRGVFSPRSTLSNKQLDESTLAKLNLLYAKDYKVSNDLNIMLKALKNKVFVVEE